MGKTLENYLNSIITLIIKKKGYYIKKSKKDQSIFLNVYISDFAQYINDQPNNKGWLKFRIYERDIIDDRGYTHNMELISVQTIENITNHVHE